MEVTKENFAEAASLLEELLPSCAFVAFDLEMTGIMDPGHLGTKPEFSDDVQQRYEKMCRIVGEFAVMQVGVCTFHAAPGGGFVARPFNFYVFPDRQSKTRITMYSDTAAFHVDNHMDFTKWYCGGVPFMTEADHAAAKARAVEPAGGAPAGGSPRPPLTLTRASDKVLVDGAMERVRAWEAAAAAGSGDAAELELPPCNSFLRRALCERLEAEFPELAVESRAVEGRDRDRKLAVMRLSATQKAEKAARELREKLRRLDDRAGFLRVWRALCTARKPIIGHNCLYDLLFTYAAFEGALPPTVAGWKAALHGVLPEVWDTKLLSVRSGEYDDTALKNLHQACAAQLPPTEGCTFADGFGERYGGGKEACHEAAYDAWMTGVSYYAMRKRGLAPDACRGVCYLMRSVLALRLPTAADESLAPASAALHLSFAPSTPADALLAVLQAELATHPWAVDAAACGALRHTHPIAEIELRWASKTEAFALLPGVAAASLERAAAAARAAGFGALTLAQWLERRAAEREAAAAERAAAAAAAAEVPPRRQESEAAAGVASLSLSNGVGTKRPAATGDDDGGMAPPPPKRQASGAGRWAWLQRGSNVLLERLGLTEFGN